MAYGTEIPTPPFDCRNLGAAQLVFERPVRVQTDRRTRRAVLASQRRHRSANAAMVDDRPRGPQSESTRGTEPPFVCRAAGGSTARGAAVFSVCAAVGRAAAFSVCAAPVPATDRAPFQWAMACPVRAERRPDTCASDRHQLCRRRLVRRRGHCRSQVQHLLEEKRTDRLPSLRARVCVPRVREPACDLSSVPVRRPAGEAVPQLAHSTLASQAPVRTDCVGSGPSPLGRKPIL